MKKRKTHIIINIITILLAVVLINYLGSRHFARLDLTEDRLYTLSDSTENIIQEVPDVVTIRVFFSYDLPPPLFSLKRNVDDMLSEFKQVGGNKIQIEYINPSANPVEEHKTMMLGIVPVQLNIVEHDRQELAKVFLGMTVSYLDQTEVLPVVQSTANLEYRLAQAIIKASQESSIKVGWWCPDDKSADKIAGGFQGLIGLLGNRYEVVEIKSDNIDKVDISNFTTLILASPGMLSDDELYAIDQFLMSGGKIILLVENWDISDKLITTLRKTNISRLLDVYGIKIEKDLVADRSNAMASFTGDLMTYHLPYPFWPKILANGFSPDSQITNELASLILPWTSSVSPKKDYYNDIDILVKTSSEAAAVTGEHPKIDPESAREDLERITEKKAYPLVVEREGGFESAFGIDKIKVPKGLLYKDRSVDVAKLFVVGSSRFAQDYFLRLYPQNIAFIENAVDSFAMGDKLIGIRSRVGIERPVEILSNAFIFLIRSANIIIGPIVVMLIALFVFVGRRWRRKKIQKIYGG